jgi:phospholipase D1/2
MPAPILKSASRVTPLFDVGRNCCALAHAGRVALLVDGEDYYRAFLRAAQNATRSIVILAWDFNSHARLHFDRETWHGPPARLGDFLNWLVRRRRSLHVRVLDWDYPMVFGTDREFPPLYGLGWTPHHRVEVAYDNTHPVGGSHHQKIVVIDDAMAFVGGFDLTERRWDTCAHSAQDARRTCTRGPYPPFHDLMVAVDGEAARALADITRARWEAATQHRLAPVPASADPWPDDLRPDLTDVDVAIARTLPGVTDGAEVREVEALYLDMIARARRHIYIENQYFTAPCIGDALAARLAEAGGPEIVLISRLFSHGWLEEHTMELLRANLIRQLREADREHRFQVYYPHIDGLAEGTCIDVHSKLMIVDDEILRIGSANLCNRSMGMDSECDVALEARGDPAVSATLRAFRNRLLGEHLDVPPARVEREVARRGSLLGAIEALRGEARSLRPLDSIPESSEALVELAKIADPERPVSLDQLVEEFTPDTPLPGPRFVSSKIVAVVLALVSLTLLWRHTPLADYLDAGRVSAWARQFADRPWAPLAVLGAYTPACLVMFPRPLITLAAVIAFGPLLGFGYALSGILLAALLTYLAGRRLPRGTVRSVAGQELNHMTATLRRRGLLAVTALRLVPLAPFAVEGLVAGAIHIKLWHFMLGTLLGILPGTLASTVFGKQLEAALRDPAEISYGWLAVAILIVVLLSLAVRRWLIAQQRLSRKNHAEGQGDASHGTR